MSIDLSNIKEDRDIVAPFIERMMQRLKEKHLEVLGREGLMNTKQLLAARHFGKTYAMSPRKLQLHVGRAVGKSTATAALRAFQSAYGKPSYEPFHSNWRDGGGVVHTTYVVLRNAWSYMTACYQFRRANRPWMGWTHAPVTCLTCIAEAL